MNPPTCFNTHPHKIIKPNNRQKRDQCCFEITPEMSGKKNK